MSLSMVKDLRNNPYAPGKHVLLDCYGAHNLTDVEYIEQAMCEAAKACKASILEIKLHSFGVNEGVTGVALLAESHISIHTWPEDGFAAIDIFVCGSCDASLAIEPLKEFFKPIKVEIKEVLRGGE